MGGVWHTTKRRKQTCVGAPTVETGSCSLGGMWRTAKRDSTGLSFIHCRLPPASNYYCSSTVDFLQPPPATVQQQGPIHLASTGYCSTGPPRGPIHRPPTGSIEVMFIQRQRPLLPRGPVHPTPTGNCSSNPPTTLTVHPEATLISFS